MMKKFVSMTNDKKCGKETNLINPHIEVAAHIGWTQKDEILSISDDAFLRLNFKKLNDISIFMHIIKILFVFY